MARYEELRRQIQREREDEEAGLLSTYCEPSVEEKLRAECYVRIQRVSDRQIFVPKSFKNGAINF